MGNSFANYPSLRGKNILITGGASGIGKELVKGFAEQGSNVAFLDLNYKAGERLSLDTGENVFFQKWLVTFNSEGQKVIKMPHENTFLIFQINLMIMQPE